MGIFFVLKQGWFEIIKGQNLGNDMILNDRQIGDRVGMIKPYDPNLRNGEGYDLTLGDTIEIRRLCPWWLPSSWEILSQPDGKKIINRKAHWLIVSIAGTTKKNPYYLRPGDRFLASSQQELHIPEDVVSWGFLKSGRARELLQHFHATFIDATFEGNLTFEFVNHDIVKMPIWEGMRVFQLVFAKTTPAMNPYRENGHYYGDKGVQQSKGYYE